MSTTTTPEPVGAGGTPANQPTRLMSLDALRGFDMFWIVGADALVEGLRKVSDNGLVQGLAHQLEHVGWAGFHFEDLIFPMFVFIVGVSLVFSLGRTIEQEGRAGSRGADRARARCCCICWASFYYGGFSTPFQADPAAGRAPADRDLRTCLPG